MVPRRQKHIFKFSWCLISLVMFPLFGFGQSQLRSTASIEPTAIRQPNAIDSILTAAQAQEFVRSHAQYMADFVLQKIPNPEDCVDLKSCINFKQSAEWIKADFDGNGRTDLLVAGYQDSAGHNRAILCLLDSGKQKFFSTFLTSRSSLSCSLPALIQIGNKPAIQFAMLRANETADATNTIPFCQVDTLIYDASQFIEYTATLKHHRIQLIAFSTAPCYGRCPVFDLAIDDRRAATYRAGKFSQTQGEFTATIDELRYQELLLAINKADFSRLKSNYSIGATDHPTCTLTVTYDGGKVKTIEDYGEQGTFGLKRVYHLLFALRNNQQWK